MDLATLISDKQLLANLTREYELLKATNASVNYEEWITKRLQLAAAAKQKSTQRQTAQPAADSLLAAPGLGTALQGFSSAPRTNQQFIIGSSDNSQAAPVAGTFADAHQHEPEAAQKHYRQQHNVLQSQPHSVGTQPQWVATARLQTSLQSSGVVPLMHAAAERDRKLAATAALVRERLTLGDAAIGNVTRWHELFQQQHGQQLLGQQQQQQQHAMPAATTSIPGLAAGAEDTAAAQHEQQHQQQQENKRPQQQQQAQDRLPAAQPIHRAELQSIHVSTAAEFANPMHMDYQQQQQQQSEWPQQQQQTPDQLPMPQPSHGTEQQPVGASTAAEDAIPVGQDSQQQQHQQKEQQQQVQEQQQHQEQPLLPEAVQNSWLVKSVLQANNGRTAVKQEVLGKSPAPEFIRITGAAATKPARQQGQQQQQQPKNQQQGLNTTDRRSQLKSALKQMITSTAGAGLQQDLGQLVAMLQGLLGVEQQQQQHHQQQQQQQQGLFDGQQQQLQQVAVQLQRLLQGLGNKAAKQQQRMQRTWQDENAEPWDDRLQQELSTPPSTAKQQLRQQHKLQKAAAAAAGARSPQQHHQQQQRQRAKPAWQSEVYVPPPVHLLKRKNAGFADAWGQPTERKLPPVRQSSAAKLGRPRPLSARPAGRPANKAAQAQHRQQQQLPCIQHAADDTNSALGGYAAAGSSWVPEHADAQEQQLFVDDLLVAATKLNNPSSGGRYHGLQSRGGFQSAAAAAGAAGAGVTAAAGRQSAAGAFGGLSAVQVQDIEQQVQQQLQQEKQQEEAARLSRLEQTASHILGAVARLEQQLQQPQATVPAPAATSPAAETDNPLTSATAAAAPIAAPAAPAAAPPAASANQLQDPAVMCDLLSTLERLEAQEQEICKRWFGSSSEASAVPVGRQSAEVTTTVVIPQPTEIASAPHVGHQAAVSQAAAHQAPNAVANSSILAASLLGSPATEAPQQEPLSKETLRSIKSGRRRFLKHQALVDGNLEVLDAESPSPTFDFRVGPSARAAAAAVEKHAAGKRSAKQQLQPTLVVEAVADLLLDELMMSQVQELEGFMDALCSQLFDEEFKDA